MSGRHPQAVSALLLGATALAGWARLNRRTGARRRSAFVLTGRTRGEARGSAGAKAEAPVPRLRLLLSRLTPARPRWLVPELLLLPTGLGVGYLLCSPVPAVAAMLVVLPLRRRRISWRVGREARARAAAVVELCAALAGELRSGATPEQALDTVISRGRAAEGLPGRLGSEAVVRLAAGRYGADVPSALRWLAELPGGGGASAIAACWQVTADSGTGLAAGLDQVAEALRAERALAEEIQSELAGPRTTAGLLAALPVFGLVLGGALGAQPSRILLHTPLGLGCLGVGAALEAAGLSWTARIVRSARGDDGLGTAGPRGGVGGGVAEGGGTGARTGGHAPVPERGHGRWRPGVNPRTCRASKQVNGRARRVSRAARSGGRAPSCTAKRATGVPW